MRKNAVVRTFRRVARLIFQLILLMERREIGILSWFYLVIVAFCDVAHNRETCSNCNVWSAQGSKLDVFVSASLTVVRWLCLSLSWNMMARCTVYHSLDLYRCKVTTCCREMLLRDSQRTFSGFSNRTAAGADILAALSCCSGCQLFVEGRRRHPRRGSFGCVSTVLDKTTAFFCGTGFCSYAISRLSCVVPSASGAPCRRDRFHMLACGVFDLFIRPQILQM